MILRYRTQLAYFDVKRGASVPSAIKKETFGVTKDIYLNKVHIFDSFHFQIYLKNNCLKKPSIFFNRRKLCKKYTFKGKTGIRRFLWLLERGIEWFVKWNDLWCYKPNSDKRDGNSWEVLSTMLLCLLLYSVYRKIQINVSEDWVTAICNE